MLTAAICIALNLLIYYDIITLCAFGILLFGLWQQDQKKMLLTLASFYIAVVVVVGMPLGFIKSIEPEANVPPKEVVKEVKSWLN